MGSVKQALAPVPLVRGRNGAVASPHHLATGAGTAILRAGGSAVDAAIATNAALSVAAGYACGLGGDAFWLIWDPAAHRALALNGSGRSAAGASIDAARAAGHATMPLRGAWSVTVPGAVDSWREAHARLGRLPWQDLLAPAIDLADGFPASEAWTAAIERAADAFGAGGDWARAYRPAGRPWRPGETVRLPALAATLRRLAEDGPETLYRGGLARRTAAYLEAAGSPLRAVDLEGHRSEWRQPISVAYRGVTSLSHPPNSVGVVALQGLGLLARLGQPEPGSWDGRGCADERWVHLGLEVSRLGLGERDAYVTDAASMGAGAATAMLGAERLDELASRLADRALPARASRSVRGGGTIALATADRDGGLVSMLASNYMGFGSGLVDPETGIAFQDRGAFFSLDPSHPNRLEPRKRTMHTLTPGILLRDGLPWVAHGSMGGEIQPQVFIQLVSALVDGGLDLATAIGAPRWGALMREHLGPPLDSVLEAPYHAHVPEALRDRGHRVVAAGALDSAMGHAQAVEVVRDAESGSIEGFTAAADPRSEGLPGAC
jgi:gamma-glutamyltranspeptidase / glutathione hydrolase